MDTDTPSRQRRYSTDEQAAALVALAENGGNVEGTAAATGIPASTIRHWRDADVKPPPASLVAQEKLRRAANWDRVQDMAVEQVLTRLPEASARDAAVVAGIAVDKAVLLRGDGATAADPEAAARIEMFRARYAASQALHVHVHLAPGQVPNGPAPIVLEPLENKAIEGAERPEGESAGG